MQQDIEQSILKVLEVTRLDVKDVLKALTEMGFKDLNKSSVNKVLYALEKRKLVQRTDTTPPIWSTYGVAAPHVSPVGERLTVLFIDEDTQPCLKEALELSSQELHVICGLKTEPEQEAKWGFIYKLESDSQDAMLISYTMRIVSFLSGTRGTKTKVILITADPRLMDMLMIIKTSFPGAKLELASSGVLKTLSPRA